MRHLLCVLFIVFQLNFHRSQDIAQMAPQLDQVNIFVPKLEPCKEKSWHCDCYNSTESGIFEEPETECRCCGKDFKEVPIDLDENLHAITISESDIKFIDRYSFQPYRFTIHEVVLEKLPYLRVIQSGTFRDIPNLRTVYISDAPQIKFLHGLFDGVTSRKFLSLRIVQTSLLEIPDLSNLHPENIMHMIDLDGNKIEKIPTNRIKFKAEQVTLNYNEINSVEDFAFNGSQIGKLSLRGNRGLTKLGENVFNGLNGLSQLDLSETSIERLPVVGIADIVILKIEKTPSMKVIPSVHEFNNLKEAYLTHPFHCCAFKYPEQHDPKRHAQYEEMRQFCKQGAFDTGQEEDAPVRKKRSEDDEESWSEEVQIVSHYNVGYGGRGSFNDWGSGTKHRNVSEHSELLRGKTIEHGKAKPLNDPEIDGTFDNNPAEISANYSITAFCGDLSIRASRIIKCYPEPNALNPCEDIMGSYYLRISVWFVLVLAVLGNLAVIVVVLFSGGEVTVPRFLMCNLAFADLCMGLYLLLIASMDLHSVGTYFNFAFDWQYGVGCQVAGFLTVFASQLSIFILTVVTVERWFAIAYAIYLTRRIRLGLAAKVMIIGWLYSIFMACLPLLGVSNYSSTSICLPMEVNRLADQAYLIVMIAVNGLAFVLIVFCYAQIYFSLAYETRHSATKGEMTIAKKMALLVFTDFVCWAPIAFFALTALAGYPLIGVTRSKILLVFFYPLNSCANPYLYAMMTAQYRKDLFVLLNRIGICKRRNNKKSKNGVNTTVLTHLTLQNHTPLIARSNGTNVTILPQSSGPEDAFV